MYIEAIRARHANGATPWRPDIAVLLAEIDGLRKDVSDAAAALGTLMTRGDAVLELHRPRADGTCRECDGGATYPCPTARALGVES